MTKKQSYSSQDALDRATANRSEANYSAIYSGFAKMGLSDIQPRVNVFTYNAWKALGRCVSKGQHGVKVVTVIETEKHNKQGKLEKKRYPKTTTVFHISQTEKLEQ